MCGLSDSVIVLARLNFTVGVADFHTGVAVVILVCILYLCLS